MKAALIALTKKRNGMHNNLVGLRRRNVDGKKDRLIAQTELGIKQMDQAISLIKEHMGD